MVWSSLRSKSQNLMVTQLLLLVLGCRFYPAVLIKAQELDWDSIPFLGALEANTNDFSGLMLIHLMSYI